MAKFCYLGLHRKVNVGSPWTKNGQEICIHCDAEGHHLQAITVIPYDLLSPYTRRRLNRKFNELQNL